MNEKYVTSLSYLKLSVRSRYPKFMRKYVKFLMSYGSIPFIKIFGMILGLGTPISGIKRYSEIFVTLNDGTKLATDVYVPKIVFKKNKKAPTILVRLPYWKDSFSFIGYAFASYGFVTVVQDIRGTGHSEGFNYFLFTEREDGLEVLKWISNQYWYNGKIGMAGASYFGITQLALSWDNKYLTCISPAITSTLNLWKDNGGLQIHALTTSIYRIMVNIVSHREAPDVDRLTTLMQERYLNPRYALFNDPLKKKRGIALSQLKGKNITEIQDLLIKFYNIKDFNPSIRNYKIFFKFLDSFLITQRLVKDTPKMSGFLEMDASKFSQPAFMVTGWQDMFFEKQLEDFREIKTKASGEAKKFTKLLIGSWAHAAIGHPESRIRNGGIVQFFKKFINLNWQKYWLMDDKSSFPDIDKPSIKYWVMGRKIWRYTEEWPPNNSKYSKLYLHSEGNANGVRGKGFLNSDLPQDEPEDNYEFDPINPVITRGGRNLGILKGAHDQRKAEKRQDVLVYSTERLNKGIELTGLIKIMLYASSSAKDTDFMVKLVDVYPRGKAINILDAGIRARFRNGETNPTLIEPGEVYKYEIVLGNTSNYFREGHKIRIEITSSNFPRFDINSNLGGDGKQGDFVIAKQKVFHNQKYPSHVLIPILNK